MPLISGRIRRFALHATLCFLMKINVNLPNQLTLGRLGLCALFVAALSIDTVLGFEWDYGGTVALAIFIVASLTDWLDGWIARKYNLVTDLGKLLDPLADKILICAGFVGLMAQSTTDFDGPPMWMVVVIISREFLITGLRLVAANRSYLMAADWAGKHKTISQIVYVLVSLLLLSGTELRLVSDTHPLVLLFFNLLKLLQPVLLWIALFITVASGFYYFFKNRFLFVTESEEPSALPPPIPPEAELPPIIASSVHPQVPPLKSPLSPDVSSALGVFPAFKEWQVIIEALGKGDQSIILRKGGIAEGKSGFQVRYKQFWLFPTLFHQQSDKTKPPASDGFISGQKEDGPVTLKYFAQVTQVAYIDDWATVLKLDLFHLWKEEVMRERFDWGTEKGLHCIMVRIHRVLKPVTIDWKSEFAGCKSWVEVPVDFSKMDSVPVLDDESYASLRSKIVQS